MPISDMLMGIKYLAPCGDRFAEDTDNSSGSETGSSPQHSSESDATPELENVPTTPTLVHEDPVDPATPTSSTKVLSTSEVST